MLQKDIVILLLLHPCTLIQHKYANSLTNRKMFSIDFCLVDTPPHGEMSDNHCVVSADDFFDPFGMTILFHIILGNFLLYILTSKPLLPAHLLVEIIFFGILTAFQNLAYQGLGATRKCWLSPGENMM